MKIRQGDMWSAYDQVDLFLITANCVVLPSKKLVMGAGIAKEAAERFPLAPSVFGEAVAKVTKEPRDTYGLCLVPGWKLGLFQTKHHWINGTPLELIQASAQKLAEWCFLNPDKKVCLNFPGIGYGYADRVLVLPLLNDLPDTVEVWERP